MAVEWLGLGSGQPKPRRWKHIADGAEGAASRGASKAKAKLPKISAIRETAEAHHLFLAVFLLQSAFLSFCKKINSASLLSFVNQI